MADIHALEGGGDSQRLVFHFPVPSVANEVGVNYRTAIINSGIGGATVLPDGDGAGGTISAAEKAAIAAGQVYEFPVTLSQAQLYSSGGETAAHVLKAVRHYYALHKAEQTARIARMLRWFGYTESEA